jgi:hypothetical protein
MASVVTVLAVAIGVEGTCETTGNNSPEAERKMTSKESKVQGVIAQASVSTEARVSDKKAFSVTIRNTGDGRAQCTSKGYLPDCYVSLVNAGTQQPAEFTRLGHSLLSGQNFGGGHSRTFNLSRDESRTWNADLNDFFVLTPGDYEMTLTTKINQRIPGRKFKITVDKLKFTITD